MKTGIAFKLGCLLAVFGVLVSGLTGYHSYSSSRSSLLKASERDLLTATQVLGRNLRGSLDNISRDVRMLAAVSSDRDLPKLADKWRRHSERDLVSLFRATMLVHPEYLQIRLISAAGYGLEQVRVDRDGDQLIRVGEDQLQEKGHYAYVFDTLRLAAGQVRLSPIVINHELGAHAGLGKPTLHVSSPVLDGDGKVFGLIVVNVDLDLLFAQLKSDLPEQYRVYLANNWGDLLIHPDHRKTFGFDQGRRLFLQDEFPQVTQLLAPEGPQSLISRGSEAHQEMLAAFVRLAVGDAEPKRFVVLGMAQPEDHVLAETQKLGQRIAQVVVLASLFAVLIAILASRALSRPLTSINNAVQQFTHHRQRSPLPTARHDELGQLARSFAQMQEEILDQLDELSQSRNALEHLARHDALTGLPNRRMFFERLEHALATARRSALQLAVLFVDLDHFKELNDSFGHSTGDGVLQAVANLLRSATRESDTVARLGGDEFVILIEQLEEPQQVIAVLHKLHERLQLPMLIGGEEIQVQASMGVALFPRDGDDIESLLQQADRAMYAAKNAGRNTFNFEAPEPR